MVDVATSIMPARREIVALMKSETLEEGRIVGVQVFEGSITDGERVPTDTNGVMIPYLAIVFGGRGPVAQRQQGITGTRDDMKRFTFGMELFARSANELNDFSDRVEDIMQGMEFTNTGEVSVINSGSIENPADVKQNHAREGRGLLFSCFVNTVAPNPLPAV